MAKENQKLENDRPNNPETSALELFGTLGPACADIQILEKMIQNGMNGIRLNLSHGPLAAHEDWIDKLHQAMENTGKEILFLMDLKGRELRIKELKPFELEKGQLILFGKDIPVETDLLVLPQTGDKILIDDGKIELIVLKILEDGNRLCEVLRPAVLKANKSVKITGKISPFSPLCPEDLTNLDQARKYRVNAIMVPFVQSRRDLEQVHHILEEKSLDLKIYAKIENQTGIDHLESFMDLADVIVIARGDLGNDVGFYDLPAVQARIEKICHQHQKDYMVVTQMLTSMIDSPICTRAEANDVFYAIKNGASSIMVTNETAIGHYPELVIDTMKKISDSAIRYKAENQSDTN
ncbi:pyruvate kinase [Ileibacterium valens]|uniref:pyruvate kinase n=1 Tax=Ileibacterium valens TaxID=1862668 RepID=UPI0024BAD5D3|nr:pyruvate kinase [Ileibacterium valens]